MSNAADVESLPLVQVLNDAEGLTAKRVKIIGTEGGARPGTKD
jgi:hypothetical protein